MQVTVKQNPAFLVEMPDQILGVVDGRMQKPVGLLPLSIEIDSKKWAPVITINDPIWIEHWHNSYDEMLPELLGLRRQEVFEDAIEHMGCLGLPRMHPACEHNGLLQSMVLHIFYQPLVESCEWGMTAHQVVLIKFVELLDFLFDGGLEQPLDATFRFVTLLGKFYCATVLLTKSLLHDSCHLVHQA